MGQEQLRDVSNEIHGIVELDQSPATKGFITRISESVISGLDFKPRIALDELIPQLKRVADGGGTLDDYIAELENKNNSGDHEISRIASVVSKLKGIAGHDKQVIIDGHQVGGKITAVVAKVGAVGALMSGVGAGIFMRIADAPSRPKPAKEPAEGETDDNPQERS